MTASTQAVCFAAVPGSEAVCRNGQDSDQPDGLPSYTGCCDSFEALAAAVARPAAET